MLCNVDYWKLPTCDPSKLHYPIYLMNEEWARIDLLVLPAKQNGNTRMVKVGEVVNGRICILDTGYQ